MQQAQQGQNAQQRDHAPPRQGTGMSVSSNFEITPDVGAMLRDYIARSANKYQKPTVEDSSEDDSQMPASPDVD